jgi:hypothetical protein
MANAYINFVGKPEGKIPLGRFRCWCENNISKWIVNVLLCLIKRKEVKTGTNEGLL